MSAEQQAAAAAAFSTELAALEVARGLHQGRSEEEQRITQQQQKRSVALLDVAPRPDAGGTKGRPIDLKVNMYSVGIAGAPAIGSRSGGGPKVKDVYHYHVTIKAVQARSSAATFPARLQHEVFEAALESGVAKGTIPKNVAQGLAFDGRANAYASKELPEEKVELECNLAPKVSSDPRALTSAATPVASDRRFTVTLTRVAVIDLEVLLPFCRSDRRKMDQIGKSVSDFVATALQALEVMLRHDPTKRFKVHGAQGRRFFDPELAVPIANGAEIWKGFFQSIRPTQGGLVVNIDVAFSAFLGGGDFLTVCAKICGVGGGGGGAARGGRGGRGGDRGRGAERGARGGRGRGGFGGGGAAPSQSSQMTDITPAQQRQLRKALRGVQLRVTHRPTTRLEKFVGFSPQSAAQTSFQDRDGKTQTLVNYFRQTYNYTIRFPHLPCVLLGGDAKVPPECLVVLPGTPLPPLSLNPNQVQDMISQSAQKPEDRYKRITEIRGTLAYEKSEHVHAWGLDIAAQPVQLQGRVLNAPTVTYAAGKTIRSNNGGWNLANVKFTAPGRPLTSWSVVNFSGAPQPAVLNFVGFLVQTLRGLGVVVENTQPVYINAYDCRDPSGVKDKLDEAGRSAVQQAKVLTKGRTVPPQLFLCVMDKVDAGFYEAIKRAAALQLASPVLSQVLNTKKALNERGMPQYCANVAMKINVKLGGTNQIVTDRDLPRLGAQTMLMGADVTHAGPGSDLPSIAATVATIDGHRQRYSSQIRTQRNLRGGSQEIMMEAESMFVDHLKAWVGPPPSSIIVFRDGISEGQYTAALDNEVRALKQACQNFRPKYAPKITYVVAAKRHHVRFFAQDAKDNDQRSASLPAGTIVDKTATHPYAFDFYLQAHGGLVGTPRPTHYIVLLDENGFNSDSLQTIVNSLCYSYSRATRSVSLVPPAYYADILAEKARALVYGEGASDTATSVNSGSRPPPSDFDSKDVMKKLERDAFFKLQWYM